MTPAKRAMDLIVGGILALLLLPVGLGIAAVILLRDGRPILYRSERMATATRGFTLLKFRTMRTDATDTGVTGGDKSARITRTGRWLRAHRLDELPQIWNVLKGDVSLVGPRPPLRLYVDAAPDLYSRVLRSRPGLTGLATLVYHRHEARLLAGCRTGAETHETYLRRCVPTKARLDLIYQRNRSLCFDLVVLWRDPAGHSLELLCTCGRFATAARKYGSTLPVLVAQCAKCLIGTAAVCYLSRG